MTDYSQFKCILENNKQELLKTISSSEFIQKSDSNELSLYDNHPADTGTELEDKEKEMALSSHNKEELRKIENALKAIENGTYGKCKECGAEIPIERLEAIPSTLFCISHTDEKSIAEDRPNEEIILRELFDSKYDPNNSFTEVATFGTSETPADFKDSADHYDELYNPEFKS
jgi:YteA family regulatory protein